jgi:hypothetical protein
VQTLSQLFMAQQQNVKISLFRLDRELCWFSLEKYVGDLAPRRPLLRRLACKNHHQP